MAVQPRTSAKSLVRGMDVLRAVAESPDGCSPAQIAERVDIPRPTVYRLLTTLSDLGLVERDPDGAWTVGLGLVRLGRKADLARTLVPRAQPFLERLVAETGESAMLAVARGAFDIDVVAQLNAPTLLGMANWIGRPLPLHASAAGKIILAELGEDERAHYSRSVALPRLTPQTIIGPEAFLAELRLVAEQGYAETIDEMEDGLTGIAAPVRNGDDGVLAAIGIYGPTARIATQMRKEMIEEVLAAASDVSSVLRA